MQQDSNDLSESLAFDMADFDKRLQQTLQETSHALRQSMPVEKPLAINEASDAATAPTATDTIPPQALRQAQPESSLLAKLASEAKANQDSKQTLDQDKQARAARVHNALDRIFKYFTPFIQHVNNIEHKINREYRLDARTVFSNLQWQGANLDSRKQSLAESAHLAYVVFNLNLGSPEPVLIKRPWDQFAALKKELQHLRLNLLDDLDELHKNPQQEWLQARLDPVLLVQVLFKGNYDSGMIDIATRNIEELGTLAFRLEPDTITLELLDELGLFLIGRSNKLPALLQHK